jgi:hypothetical protein
MHRASTDEVNMEVKHRLSRSRSDVEHGAIAIFNGTLARNMRSCQMATANQFSVLGSSFFQSGNVLFRNDQDVGWTLRIQVLESKRVLVFVDFFGWDFASNDTAKQTINRHDLLSSCLV